MSDENRADVLDVESIAQEFDRVRRGYDPAAVDEHLALVTSQVRIILAREAEANGSDESLDVVLKATRRSVDEALQDARQRADSIVAEAHARAAETIAAAEERSLALSAEGRERYLEMGQLVEVRGATLAEVDRQIAERRQVLQTAATELAGLADGLDGAAPEVRRLAAMDDSSVEIVLNARPARED